MRTKILIPLVLCLASTLVSAQASNLNGIAHVAFRVSDLDKARQFYGKLGFEQAFDFKDDHGNVTQAFIKINDRQFIELYPRTQEGQPVGLTHVCYEASDIESVRSFYVKQGLNPPDAKKARAGNLLFIMHDPEDQVVEFTQYMPGSLHSEDQGKHLGAHRIADHLSGAILPVTNLAREREYYARVLEEVSQAGVPAAYKAGPDEVKLEPVAKSAMGTIILRTDDEKRAERSLQELGFGPKQVDGAVQITDPDGNVFVFRKFTKLFLR